MHVGGSVDSFKKDILMKIFTVFTAEVYIVNELNLVIAPHIDNPQAVRSSLS